MVILRVSAGQANQMLEFAAAYALAKARGEELFVDISPCVESDRGYQLDYFNIPDMKKICYDSSDTGDRRVSPKSIPASFLTRGKVYSDVAPSMLPYNGLSEACSLEGDPVILNGYFFSRVHYYEPYWAEIREFFTPKFPSPFFDEFSRLSEGRETVGIHIRRTDFLLADWAFIPEADFFRAAICWYRHILSAPRFFCFSDDIEYAKSILGQDSDLFYMNVPGHNEAPFAEFLCLSRCRHKILSNNSTFSNLAFDLNEESHKTALRRSVPDSCDAAGDRKHSLVTRIRKRIKKFLAGFPLARKGSTYFMDTQGVRYWAKKYCVDGKNPITNYAGKIRDVVACRDHLSVLEKTTELFMNVGELEAEDRKVLAYRRFVALAALRRPDEALDLAHVLWHDFDAVPEFHQRYMEMLCETGFPLEAAVEAVRCPPEFLAASAAFQNLQAESRGLYDAFASSEKNHILIAPYARTNVSCQILGLIPLGLVLRRLGHNVTFLLKTGRDAAESRIVCFNKNDLLTTRGGVCLGCHIRWYEDVVDDGGLEKYLKSFASSGPFSIVARDPDLCDAASALSLPYVYPGFPEGDPESPQGNKLPADVRAAMEQRAAFVLPSCRNSEKEYDVITERWSFRREQRAPEYAIRQAAALCRRLS